PTPATAPHPPSLHDALPISALVALLGIGFAFIAWATQPPQAAAGPIAGVDTSDPSLTPPRYPAYAFEHNLAGRVLLLVDVDAQGDRKSTRLNSSHVKISYAV